MKLYIVLLVLITTLTSCKESNETNSLKQIEITETATAEVVNKETPISIESANKGTFLCEINGKDWAYTKASGIVDTHAKTKKRTAIMTFTKKLDKGSESVQLFYDADSYQLEKATAILKTPKKGGGTMSAMYQLLNEGGKRTPDSVISGVIDLSNATVASGTAEVSNMKIRFKEDELEDASMEVITFSSLKFSGVGYSDLDKVFGNN
ncbi:hypothetical protein [Winogradskyella thalassocola]|uniref:Uncharacterized protein n=1 Tax=Winogradskyella thalassocola TaxID=262004 RepID=A0A1G8BKF1_9FLAO|nr:hypothetical protein [Winogradskyella thalassocola]SDH33679.1 hypothetical protein SAMN04489796_102353 [Winogradskyella thalassocola]